MLQVSMTAGSPDSNPLETAVMLNSFKGVLMWMFFIVVAIVLAIIYIKKKNATGEKHS